MLVIDRIEEGLAVCEAEDGSMIKLLEFPYGAKEGDVLTQNSSGEYLIDANETTRRRAEAINLSLRIKRRRQR